MKSPIFNLIFGLLLLVAAIATASTWFVSGQMPLDRVVWTLALLLFAASRLIRFKAPESQLVRPIRGIAFAVLILAIFMKGHS
jgi:hypothetical protein